MAGRVLTATRMGFREQLRRPLLIVLLVVVPFFFITRAIATTLPSPRAVGLPGDQTVLTTMKEVHGANMLSVTVSFLAGLCGVFVMQSAREADRRLVVAGFRPLEAVAPRLAVLGAATLLVLGVSLGVTAISFSPEAWAPFAVGNLLLGLVFGAIGALAGALFGRLGATYLMLFLPMVDVGIAQNPMFGDGKPDAWASVLPGYGPMRVVTDGAFSPGFHAGGALVLGLAWTLALAATVAIVLRRGLSVR